MSREEPEPSVGEHGKPPEISLPRVLVEMAGIAAVGALIGFLFFSAKAGFGILVGGGLAFANYYWQKQSLKAIFDAALQGEKSRFLGLKYALRYVVIGGALFLIYLGGVVSIVGVVFGLASFAIAVMIEGIRSLFTRSQ